MSVYSFLIKEENLYNHKALKEIFQETKTFKIFIKQF